jgi:hypothetical protein
MEPFVHKLSYLSLSGEGRKEEAAGYGRITRTQSIDHNKYYSAYLGASPTHSHSGSSRESDSPRGSVAPLYENLEFYSGRSPYYHQLPPQEGKAQPQVPSSKYPPYEAPPVYENLQEVKEGARPGPQVPVKASDQRQIAVALTTPVSSYLPPPYPGGQMPQPQQHSSRHDSQSSSPHPRLERHENGPVPQYSRHENIPVQYTRHESIPNIATSQHRLDNIPGGQHGRLDNIPGGYNSRLENHYGRHEPNIPNSQHHNRAENQAPQPQYNRHDSNIGNRLETMSPVYQTRLGMTPDLPGIIQTVRHSELGGRAEGLERSGMQAPVTSRATLLSSQASSVLRSTPEPREAPSPTPSTKIKAMQGSGKNLLPYNVTPPRPMVCYSLE